MKTLACKDVSGKSRPFVAKGMTDEEVMSALSKHGEKVHPELTENATSEDMAMMQKKMKQSIHVE